MPSDLTPSGRLLRAAWLPSGAPPWSASVVFWSTSNSPKMAVGKYSFLRSRSCVRGFPVRGSGIRKNKGKGGSPRTRPCCLAPPSESVDVSSCGGRWIAYGASRLVRGGLPLAVDRVDPVVAICLLGPGSQLIAPCCPVLLLLPGSRATYGSPLLVLPLLMTLLQCAGSTSQPAHITNA